MSTDSQVMQMVREQLERDPPPPLAALYGRVVRLNPEIQKFSPGSSTRGIRFKSAGG